MRMTPSLLLAGAALLLPLLTAAQSPTGDCPGAYLHSNFLINTGEATAADLEGLGEAVRADVKAKTGIELEWEIKRIGLAAEEAE